MPEDAIGFYLRLTIHALVLCPRHTAQDSLWTEGQINIGLVW